MSLLYEVFFFSLFCFIMGGGGKSQQCSGVYLDSPGSVLDGTVCDAEDRTQFATCKARTLLAVLSPGPVKVSFERLKFLYE